MSATSKALKYSLLDAIKERDFWFIWFMITDWYYETVRWRIHHHVLNERCENCRNWHFCGKWEGRDYGTCDISAYWYDYHDHCGCWNLEPKEDNRYCNEEGMERPWDTPCGRKITQFVHGGVWQYKHEGYPSWY